MTRLVEDWLQNDATQGLFDVYAQNGWQLFAVGGCVRNALLGVEVSDIDMASDAPPATAIKFLEASGYRVIPTGLDHGTLTVIVSSVPYEITTFRKDVTTDGRRATVAFAQDIQEDARRRDFTINALYVDREGLVLDPYGEGLDDIAVRRVRFIEGPSARITEDYLRILRFFRFHARFASDPPDKDTMDAIARNIDGLGQLSIERITSEMLKILSLPNPAPTCGLMQQSGVLPAVMQGVNIDMLAPFVHVTELLGLPPDPIARLAALGGTLIGDQLRLSKAQSRNLSHLAEATVFPYSDAALAHELGPGLGAQAVALRCAMMSAPPSETARDDIVRGAKATFPVTARDIGLDFKGAAIGKRLKQLKQAWYASDLTMSKPELLALDT